MRKRLHRGKSSGDRLHAVEKKLDRIIILLSALTTIQKREFSLTMKTLEDLQTDVAAETDATKAAATLLSNLSKQIADLKTTQTDPATAAKIDALAASVEGATADLAAAVTANTPAAAPPADTGSDDQA